jgi:hypothetical protein
MCSVSKKKNVPCVHVGSCHTPMPKVADDEQFLGTKYVLSATLTQVTIKVFSSSMSWQYRYYL